jgi:hypothetical protein
MPRAAHPSEDAEDTRHPGDAMDLRKLPILLVLAAWSLLALVGCMAALPLPVERTEPAATATVMEGRATLADLPGLRANLSTCGPEG